MILDLVVEVASAYISRNETPEAELPSLLVSLHDSFAGLATKYEEKRACKPSPAVSIKASVRDMHIVCLEDGLEYKSLKRHLKLAHGLSAEQYLERWGLPSNYPLVAPAYSTKRSEIAKLNNFGSKDWRTRNKRTQSQ